MAAAAGARHLAARSIVLDESTSVSIAQSPLTALAHVLATNDPNMRLYYALLSMWVKVFGESEAAVRSLSVVATALAAVALYMLGRRLFSRSAGLLAAVLFGLNAFAVQYAQTARGYALLAFLATASSLVVVLERDKPSGGLRWTYVLLAALAVYTHFFGALVVLSHVVAVMVLWRREYRDNRWLLPLAALFILCLPALAWAISSGPAAISWIPAPALSDIVDVLRDFASGDSLLLAILVISALLSLSLAARGGKSDANRFLVVLMVIPIAVSYAVSLAQPVFQPNYLIICVPPFILLATSLIARIPSLAGRAGFGILLTVIVLIDLRAWYRKPAGQDWRGATAHVLGLARSGDAIEFFPSHARRPFMYYVKHPADTGGVVPRMSGSDSAARTWLLIRKSDLAWNASGLEALRASTRERARLADRTSFRNVAVELYVR